VALALHLDARVVAEQLEALSHEVSDRAEAFAEGAMEPPDSDERLVGQCRLKRVEPSVET